MSTYDSSPQQFGVGGIVSDAFGIFFQRFAMMFALALAPAVVALVLANYVLPWVIISLGPTDPRTLAWLAGILAFIIQLFANSLSISLIVLAAFDTKVNRPGRFGIYVRWSLVNLLTVVILSIAVSLLILVPVFALVFLFAAIGGTGGLILIGIVTIPFVLYVSAVFSPLVPAIVIEGVGFGALGRAFGLTSNYRWPIVGALVILIIAIFLIGLALGLIANPIYALGGFWLLLIVNVAVNAITSGIFSVGIAMIYARLREVKEGLDVDSLADVFR